MAQVTNAAPAQRKVISFASTKRSSPSPQTTADGTGAGADAVSTTSTITPTRKVIKLGHVRSTSFDAPEKPKKVPRYVSLVSTTPAASRCMAPPSGHLYGLPLCYFAGLRGPVDHSGPTKPMP